MASKKQIKAGGKKESVEQTLQDRYMYQDFRRGTSDVLIEGKLRGNRWTMFVNGKKTLTIELGDKQSSSLCAHLYADAFTAGLEFDNNDNSYVGN